MAKSNSINTPDFISDEEMEASAGSPDFISDEEMSGLPQPKTSPGSALLRGATEGVTLGYTPQLAGIVQDYTNRALKAGGQLGIGPYADVYDQGLGGQIPSDLDTYIQARDTTARENAQLGKENPLAMGAGTIGGSVLTAPLASAKLLGGAAKGATALGKLKTAAKSGALIGATYNPGETEGEISPLQLGSRSVNAGIGAMLSAPLNLTGQGINKLADKSRLVEKLKSGELSKYAKEKIDQALKSYSRKEITPRAKELEAILRDKKIQVNPDILASSFPNLAKRMSKKVDEEGRRTISALRAQRLKKALDAKARYNKASGPFDLTAKAANEDAKLASGVVRRNLEDLDPNVKALNQEMRIAIKRRDALKKSSDRAPLTALRGKPGTDKYDIVKDISEKSNVNLLDLSQNIEKGKNLLLDPKNLLTPNAFKELGKTGVRAGAGAARLAEYLTPEAANEMAIQSTMGLLNPWLIPPK